MKLRAHRLETMRPHENRFSEKAMLLQEKYSLTVLADDFGGSFQLFYDGDALGARLLA